MSEITPLPVSGRIVAVAPKASRGPVAGHPEARRWTSSVITADGVEGRLQPLADGEGGRRPGSGGPAPRGRGAGRAERGGVAGGARAIWERTCSSRGCRRTRSRRARASAPVRSSSRSASAAIRAWCSTVCRISDRSGGRPSCGRCGAGGGGSRGWYGVGCCGWGWGLQSRRARSLASLGMTGGRRRVASAGTPVSAPAPSRCGPHRSRAHPPRPRPAGIVTLPRMKPSTWPVERSRSIAPHSAARPRTTSRMPGPVRRIRSRLAAAASPSGTAKAKWPLRRGRSAG